MTDILISGATGNTGSAILRAVSDAGASVRAMVRAAGDAARLPSGTDTVVADFDDLDSIERAVDGVRKAYLVTPSSERAEQQQIDFADRALAAGVEQVVVLSQLAARADSPVRFLRYHAAVEEHIRSIGLGYTFLRPNLYFQGLFAFAAQIAATRTFGAPIGDAAVSAIDVSDIGDVAAAALLDPKHLGRTYTLTGPESLTHEQLAEQLSRATGRTITFTDVSADDFAPALAGVLPDWQVGGLVEDYAHYSRGEAAAVTDDVPEVTGRPARTFAAFAADFAGTFTGETRD